MHDHGTPARFAGTLDDRPSSATLGAPLTVNWALSNTCNLHCDHCYSRVERHRDLTTAELLAIATKLADWGVCFVNYGGGEPLLRRDWRRVTEHCVALGLSVSLSSNGWFLDDAAAAEIRDAGVAHVALSIDHPDAAEHDRLRGGGSHERVVAAAAALGRAGVEVHVSSLVYRASLGAVDDMIALARRLGATRLNFLNLKPVGNAALHYAELNPTPDQWAAWYRAAGSLKGSRDGLFVALEDPISCSLDDGAAEPGLVQGSVCGKLTMSIKPDGGITGCGFISEVLGNALTDDLDEIWNRHAFLDAMRERDGGEACAGCDHQSACRGGCTARTYALTGTFDARDPNCWVPARDDLRDEGETVLDALSSPVRVHWDGGWADRDLSRRVVAELVDAGVFHVEVDGGYLTADPAVLDPLLEVARVTVRVGALELDGAALDTLATHGPAEVLVAADAADELRGAAAGIERLRAPGASGAEIGLTVVASARTVRALPDLIDTALDLGLDTVHLPNPNVLTDHGYVPIARPCLEALAARVAPRLAAWRGGLRFHVHDYLLWRLFAGPGEERAEASGCQAGGARAYVARSGIVFACNAMPVALGSLRTSSLVDLYDAPARLKLRSRIEAPAVACAGCSLEPSCHGGCRGLAWLADGHLHGTDVVCASVGGRVTGVGEGPR